MIILREELIKFTFDADGIRNYICAKNVLKKKHNLIRFKVHLYQLFLDNILFPQIAAFRELITCYRDSSTGMYS